VVSSGSLLESSAPAETLEGEVRLGVCAQTRRVRVPDFGQGQGYQLPVLWTGALPIRTSAEPELPGQ
jgi:hypothetical protein